MADLQETEYALLGCAMQDALIQRTVASLNPALFTDPNSRAMHARLALLTKQGKRADLVTMNADDGLGAVETVKALRAGFVPSAVNQYIAELETAAERRKLIELGNTLAADAPRNDADLDALKARAMQLLREGTSGTAMSANDAVMAWYSTLDHKPKYCQTGIAALDDVTGGISGGKLVILAARPAVGKSAFALHIANHVASHTGGVLYVSLEMDEVETVHRLACMRLGLESKALRPGEVEQDTFAAVCGDLEAMTKLPLRLCTHATTPFQIRREASAMAAKEGLAMVIVDYMQLLHADTRKKSRYEEISDISRELKVLAMDLGVPVLALSQLNRESEMARKTGNATPPSMAEARDSGAIEQDANLFISLWQPTAAPKDPDQSWKWELCQNAGWTLLGLVVNKNRSGRTGNTYIAFDKPRMQFKSLLRSERPWEEVYNNGREE